MTQIATTAVAEPTPEIASAPIAWGIGPWSRGEFAVLRTVLGDDADWPLLATLGDAVEAVDGHAAPPEVLLLAQPRPGFFEQSDAEAVGRVAPLTRLVVVAGTWCEGELRTGRPLPGTKRIYWYEFERWWRRGLEARTRGERPPWADPLQSEYPPRPLRRTAAGGASTAAMAAIEENAAGRSAGGTLQNCISVDIGDYESFETLRLALRPYGWRCIWQPRHRPEVWSSHRAAGDAADAAPVAGIWDGGQLSAAEVEQLSAFSSRLNEHAAPVIAMLDFPRAEHVAMAADAGAVRVMGKPFLVDALAGELGAAVARAADPGERRA